MAIELYPLPFQEEVSLIYSSLESLLRDVHEDSDLYDALCRALDILEPHFNNVEWQEPISPSEMREFRSLLSGMKD